MAAKSKSALSFEENMARLEELIQQLEGNALTLDQAMQAYEQGQALAKQLADQLTTAETRLKTQPRPSERSKYEQ